MIRHALTETAPAETAPAEAGRTGAPLREALERQGLTVRVDKPFRSLPSEYLVVTAPETGNPRRVWVHCNDWNGTTHYDIPRDKLMGVAAVVTDEQSTRGVFFGFGDPDDITEANPYPIQDTDAQAEACAHAVAAFFGLTS